LFWSEKSPGFISALSLIENFSIWLKIECLQSVCLGMILLDIETISLVNEHLFTPREAARVMRMDPKRQKGFTAARVALKRLSRQLGLVERNRPDQAIETLGSDDMRPSLAESGIYCSVSHSGRLVAAVAQRHPIGVDIEMVSEKVTRVWPLFMSPRERDLVSVSNLGLERTATRAWTIKEAAAKALGLHLFQAIREVEVVRVGEEEGVMRFQGKAYPVRHAEGNGSVITLVTCQDL
jgi:phosphopantetheinyl transferase